MRGRKPKPTALHILHGTFRPHRHANRIDAPGNTAVTTPSEIGVEAQAQRKREIDPQKTAIYGEAGPPDPGPRSGGSAKRIRW